MGGRTITAAIGALLAVVLQVLVAPNIAISGVAPSFVLSYAIAMALLLPPTPAYLIAFFTGLAADLLGYGPVGALPFILLVCVFAVSRAEGSFGNGTLFVSCIVLVAFVVVAHFLHAAFVIAVTSSFSAADALRLVAIPQTLYDIVLSLLLYVLLRRVFVPAQGSVLAHELPSVRLR